MRREPNVRPAIVSGRVVDEDHEPVANVRVQCARYRYLNGKKTLMPMGTATTNDKGEYRAFGLAVFGRGGIRRRLRRLDRFGQSLGRGRQRRE